MTDTFEIFWTDYPRKDKKEYARACYAKAVKAHGAPTIMAGLDRFKRKMSAEGREPKHVLHASTFLNQKVFLDGEQDLVERAMITRTVTLEVMIGGRVFRYSDLAKIKREIQIGQPIYDPEWTAFKQWQEAGNWTDIRLPPEPAQPPTAEERAAEIQRLKEAGLL